MTVIDDNADVTAVAGTLLSGRILLSCLRASHCLEAPNIRWNLIVFALYFNFSMSSESSNAGGGKKGKKKDEGPLEVVISAVARTKKKFVTTATGLGRFGIKLADASRVFAKRFAAASSVTPDKDEITIQGDVADTLAEYIVKQWPVRDHPNTGPQYEIWKVEGAPPFPNRRGSDSCASSLTFVPSLIKIL